MDDVVIAAPKNIDRQTGNGPSDAQPPVDEARTSGEGVRRASGRARDEWFTLLDDWGAAGRQHREIADWLGEHHVSRWWQKLFVEYEQQRRLRSPGVRPGGTFAVTASKTVALPVERLFEPGLLACGQPCLRPIDPSHFAPTSLWRSKHEMGRR